MVICSCSRLLLHLCSLRQYLNIHLIIFILVCCQQSAKNKRKLVYNSIHKETLKFQYSQTLPQHSRFSTSWWFWFGITRSWGSARPLPPPPRFVAAARKVVEEEEPEEPEVWWNLYRLRSYIKIYKTCKKSNIYHMNWWRISSIKSMFANVCYLLFFPRQSGNISYHLIFFFASLLSEVRGYPI